MDRDICICICFVYCTVLLYCITIVITYCKNDFTALIFFFRLS